MVAMSPVPPVVCVRGGGEGGREGGREGERESGEGGKEGGSRKERQCTILHELPSLTLLEGENEYEQQASRGDC